MSCQNAASKSWIFSALISKQPSFKDSLMLWIVMSYVNCHQKQVIHQKIGARRKKPAHGMDDAPRRWWNILEQGTAQLRHRSHTTKPMRSRALFSAIA